MGGPYRDRPRTFNKGSLDRMLEKIIAHCKENPETGDLQGHWGLPNSYDKLLDLFFEHHNPTEVNRQGPDVGDNYRSVIFYHTSEQKKAAEAKIAEIEKSGKYREPIATMVVPASTFWLAEDYHQQYLKKRNLGVCY